MRKLWRKKNEISFCVLTSAGSFRKENQDNLYFDGNFCTKEQGSTVFFKEEIVSDTGLFAIADGMGGEANGAEASLLAVNSLSQIEQPVTAQKLVDYILRVNNAVCTRIEQGDGTRMGSTFAAVSIYENTAEIVNIGDSRIYLLRDMQLQQVSVDHTAVRSLVDTGILSPEQARAHHNRHRLSQHIGIFPDELLIEPHTYSMGLKNNDLFLLCSDGLTDALTDWEIQCILKEHLSLKQKIEKLFDAALDKTKDNITIVLIEIMSSF